MNILNELTELGFILNDEVKKSIEFLNDLNLPDADKMFLYKEFKSEIDEFSSILYEKFTAGDFKFIEDKAHELKGVTKNLKFDGFSQLFLNIQLYSEAKKDKELEKSISEFKKSLKSYFSES